MKQGRTGRFTAASISICALALLAGPAPASAAPQTFEVNTHDDSFNDGACDTAANGCTLFDAIDDANANDGDDEIVFTFPIATTFEINLNADLPEITDAVKIIGPGAGVLTIDAQESRLIFDVATSGDLVEIQGLRLRRGNRSAIQARESSLTITDSTLTQNDSIYEGGAILALNSELDITGSTLSDNVAKEQGGAIYANLSELTIANSTLSGNSVSSTTGPSRGGAISALAGVVPATIASSTIADNRAAGSGGQGGGIALSTGQDAFLKNTIVADNSATATGNDLYSEDNPGDTFTATFSLIEFDTGADIDSSSGNNMLGQDPQLGPLQDNGGPTETHEIPDTSPAYNTGSTTESSDQRGFPRPQAGADDIGAYELAVAPTCRGETATVIGSSEDDVLEGTPGDDVIVGLDGSDEINAGGGDDLICAGKGADIATGGGGKDVMKLGGGRDTGRGGRGADTIDGQGGGRDRAIGQTGRDKLVGGSGRRDLCHGGSGRDRGNRSCEIKRKIP